MSRALDALVAEQVMGWREMRGHWVAPGTPDWVNLIAQPYDPPRYSSDLAAAWEVVEKLTALRPDPSHRPYSVHVLASDGIAACRITTWSVEGEGTVARHSCASVPEAICLAALEALHIPLPETV